MATKKILNIEVGKRIVKVCVSEKKGKAYAISDSFFFAIPEGSVVDGQILEVEPLAECLKKELENHVITTNNVIFSIASSKIASREVILPPVKPDQIPGIVTTNASDYFPIDVAKYIIGSTLLEQTKEESRVMVAAVPAAMVDKYIDLADYSGLVIKSIDFGGNSQYQVLKSIHKEGVDMYVTVDADCSCVTFMENGNLLLQRSLAFGGDDIVSRYISQNARSMDEYLKVYDELCVQDSGVDLSASLTRLVSGIARSVDYFKGSKYGEKPVTRVIVMGSCSHLIGLKEQIGSAIGSDAIWLEEVSDLQNFANSIGSISLYIGCIGASIAPMDCLPKEYLARTKGNDSTEKIKQNLGFVVGGAAVIISIFMLLSSVIPYVFNSLQLKKVEKDIRTIEDAEGKYTAYINYQAGEASLKSFVDSAVTPNVGLYAFFTEMEAKMPSEIVVLNASCTNDGVEMNVTVPGFDEAAKVIRQFRSFESIDVITVGAMSKTSSDTGVTEVSFSIVCAYPVPEIDEVPAEEAETANE